MGRPQGFRGRVGIGERHLTQCSLAGERRTQLVRRIGDKLLL